MRLFTPHVFPKMRLFLVFFFLLTYEAHVQGAS